MGNIVIYVVHWALTFLASVSSMTAQDREAVGPLRALDGREGSMTDHFEAYNRSPFVGKEVDMETLNCSGVRRVPWNKGRLTGQKPPLKLREIWAIRTRLQMSSNVLELALFNLAIDSKLRACDLTRLQVQDICMGAHVVSRATFMQQKTQRPVQFEITEQTRQSVAAWIAMRGLKPADYLFQSRLHASPHLSTRQYARIVHRWVASIGLDDAAYGTHTMRRTKASLIYRRTKNLRAVQLLLGHTKLESTVRYLGIEVDDALEMAEQTEV